MNRVELFSLGAFGLAFGGYHAYSIYVCARMRLHMHVYSHVCIIRVSRVHVCVRGWALGLMDGWGRDGRTAGRMEVSRRGLVRRSRDIAARLPDGRRTGCAGSH